MHKSLGGVLKITVKTFCSCRLDLLNFVTALSCELLINLYIISIYITFSSYLFSLHKR